MANNTQQQQQRILALSALVAELSRLLKESETQLNADKAAYVALHGDGCKFALAGLGAAVHMEKKGRTSISYKEALEWLKTTHPEMELDIVAAVEQFTKAATSSWAWQVEALPLTDQMQHCHKAVKQLLGEQVVGLADLLYG